MSNISISSEDIMPFLLEGRVSSRASVARKHLRYLQQWRQYLFKFWARLSKGKNDIEEIQKGVDDLISLVLLMEYVKQYDSAAIPCLRELATSTNQPSAYKLFAVVQRAVPSKLLGAVFDPDGFAGSEPIPGEVLGLPWIERISRSTCVSYSGKVPVSLFGNFHQLCLGNALEPSCRKKEVRRDRGIYYTPADLVDYLTFKTLRKAFNSCKVVEIEQVRVLDPSCGCGAFLIAGLRYIFQWIKESGEHKEDGRKVYLSAQRRLSLIRAMLFGSDTDPRAVEWTIRSLLLIVWESCVLDSVGTGANCDLPVSYVRKNILCVDFLDSSVGDGEQLQTWHKRNIHVVIGGPPFVRVEHLHKFQPEKITKYKQLYRTASAGQFDLYMLFVERAIELLADGGHLAFSISNSFLRSISGRRLRGLIAEKCNVSEIVEFDDSTLYPDATIQIALFSLCKSSRMTGTRHVHIRDKRSLRKKLASLCSDGSVIPVVGVKIRRLKPTACCSDTWYLESNQESNCISLLERAGTPIAQLAIDIRLGMSTGADEVFFMKKVRNICPEIVLVRQQGTHQNVRVESAALRPILRGRDISEYSPPKASTVCLFPYDDDGHILDEDAFSVKYPLAYEYLRHSHPRLASRRLGRNQPWYAFRSRRIGSIMRSPKIMAAGMSSGTGFTVDTKENNLIHSSVIAIYPDKKTIDSYLLLGILNSCVFKQFAKSRTPRLGKRWHVYHVGVLSKFPIVLPGSETTHDLCEEISCKAKQLGTKPHDQMQQRRIRSEIDQLVSELYGIAD